MGNENEVFDQSNLKYGEEVVISGISGQFPNSDSVLEFSENLYNKVDMISDVPRWTSKDPEVPKHTGRITGIDKFDAQFFKVGYQQARVLEPISRKIMEHAYGAIFDSGNTHATLKGKKIDVFVGASFADFSTLKMYEINQTNDFLVAGNSKAMLANRISYWGDGKGPSYCLDYSCASSVAALEKAYLSIKSGNCDAAVVGSGNIVSHPSLSLNLRRAGLLCLDGKTRCFDQNADGYVRSEAVNLIFLQKARDAKRIYAEIYHAKGIYDLKRDAQFLPIRKSDDIQRFLKDFYSETDIDPKEVEYVEANGAAIPEADVNELEAIGRFFANDKTVKVGCVKSNMGHSEAASGLAAVTKTCLAYHKGEIPANLHYNEPPNHISAIQEGRIQVLTEHSKFDRGFVAINNFSYTGASYHVVLKGHYKKKNLKKYKSQVPHLVLVSGREETSLTKIFKSLKEKPIDEEEIALLHSIFINDIVGHTGRGYTILDTNEQGETTSISESVDYYSGVRRPLWFVYSGMGSQWIGMGADLMRIPTFARAIEKCHKVLAPKGVDVVKIITEPDKTIFDNILNAFVGIGAVQIGLTDILKEMGVEPDFIIGHSLGEMACAYHDNALTAEELIQSTYSRGLAVLQSNLIKGSMAAVGVGYKALLNRCPPEICIGCHNSSESATLSGPAEAMESFVEELTSQGIFARAVPSGNVAYHSKYMAEAGPALLRKLREVIKNPKLRSKRWISTSVPRERWDDEIAKYSSPEYHTNNLLSPVYFEESATMIPQNAVLVEIAPHGLLQAILKRSHPNCTHIPLTRRGCPDGVKFLLDAVGKLYQAGYNPKVDILYPRVEFPVSTETPLLSHLVEWEHSEEWPLLNTGTDDKITSSSRDLIISTHDDDHKYITDHVINGATTIPEAALLVYVWETVAMYKGVNYRNMSIIFKDIQFHGEVTVTPEATVKLSIMISKGSDKFEISQEDTLIVSGTASSVKIIKFNHTNDSPQDDFDDIRIDSDDVYKIFEMRGFSYKGTLKSIQSLNIDQNHALVNWNDDWISFLDSLIQLNTLMRNHYGISTPKFIGKLKINVEEHKKCIKVPVKGAECHTAQIDNTLGITRCAGVQIDRITYIDKLKLNEEPHVLKERKFYPYLNTEEINIKTALDINLQVVAENANMKNINIILLITSKLTDAFSGIEEITDCILNFNMTAKSVTIDNTDEIELDLNATKTNVVLVENLLENSKYIKTLHNIISKEDYILSLEKQIPNKHTQVKEYFNILTSMTDGKEILLLLKKFNKNNEVAYFPSAMENKFSWVTRVYGELATTKKVVMVSERQPFCGLLGFVKKLKEDGHKNIHLMAIHDFHAPPFNSNNDFYKDQLDKNLVVNILKKGQWGGYYYTPCAKSTNLRNFILKSVAPGDIDKLSWTETLLCPAKITLVQVCYSGISNNDSQKAANNFKMDNESFGMDFSGIDKNGEKVMGLIPGGAMASTVHADIDLLWPVPEYWSLEDAATVPLPYVQAYYCLVLRGKLRKGQSVLIIGGAGALGQALISIAFALNCTIFTTVSDMEKKKFLLRLFPQLNENNISYSDPDDVYNMIIMNTKPQGCNFVISCASGSLREAAMKCVGFKGFFLDLSMHDILENKNIGMAYINWDRNFIAVNLSNIFRPEFSGDKKILHRCVSDGIATGIVKPLTRVVYSPTMVSRAFRLLSTRRHRGRVLIRIRDPIITNQGLNVLPRLTYRSLEVIVIVCDEKGLGIELADRLIQCGAKKLILNMKSNLISGYVQTKFISWSKREVSVKVSSENLHSEAGSAALMKNAMKLGRVTGVFIIQESKRDGNTEKDDFVNAYNKRCLVVKNLDLASRNCAELSHFTIVCNFTQNASDEYAISLSERICELRNEMGLPALVIRYESLVELNGAQFSSNKVKPQSLSTFFNALEASLKMKYKNVVTFDLKKEHNVEFLEMIAGILGVRDTKNLDIEIALDKFNLSESVLKELRAAIKKTHQIDYSTEKIRNMTIKSLINIAKLERKRSTDSANGMAAFYKELDNEVDYVSQKPITVMPTLLNPSNETSLDPNGTYLIMVPGFEGRPQSLVTVAERLKIQAVGVQLGPDMEGDSIREMTEKIRKMIKRKFEIKSKFFILGYSFGANIALELTAILENEGLTGIVYFLDSSPEALRSHIDSYLGHLPDNQLQDNILHHISYLMTGKENENLKQELQNCDTFEEKVATSLKSLKSVASHSEQNKRDILESAYKRFYLAKEYNPAFKLESELVLIKGNPHPNVQNLADDYNLSKYTKKPVKIFNIKSEHAVAYNDCRVSNIVNKFLDAQILEEFRKMSVCNVYYTQS